jgi:hypothetical protein
MTNEEIQTKAENIALANFLSNVPDNLSYDDIIEKLYDDNFDGLIDSEIVIWSPFEHFPASDVARYIEDLKDSVMWNFKKEGQ